MVEVLVFDVGGQRYGIRHRAVTEVVRAVSIAVLPKAPAVIEGVINFRGAVVPVLDIRTRFRIARKAAEPSDHLIVAKAGPRAVAVRADRALDLITIDDADVEDSQIAVPVAEYVAGIAKLPDGLVFIHDLATFLSQAEAAALDDVLPEEPSP